LTDPDRFLNLGDIMNRNLRRSLPALILGIFLATLVGCGHSHGPQAAKTGPSEAEMIQAERARLSAADRALVEAQEYCVINTDGRLGSMGAPVKITIKDQPVFLCCDSCEEKARAEPDKTLAKLDELKAKVKAGSNPASGKARE
jgi:hypothetical protein